jgi:hypothetical protein
MVPGLHWSVPTSLRNPDLKMYMHWKGTMAPGLTLVTLSKTNYTSLSCLVCPAMISRAVRYTPRAMPTNGRTNLSRWMCAAVSICNPIQKAPPMHPGMIRKKTSRNLATNSRGPVLTDNVFFSIMTTPKKALRKLL